MASVCSNSLFSAGVEKPQAQMIAAGEIKQSFYIGALLLVFFYGWCKLSYKTFVNMTDILDFS